MSVDCEGECGIDDFVELCHVCIDVILRNLAVLLADVVDEVPNGDVVEVFIGVVKFSV